MQINYYHSQWDADNTWGGVKYSGLCFETCVKMIKHTLHHQEVPLQTLVANGDKNPNVTTIDGMKLACSGNGLTAEYWYDATQADLRQWVNVERRYVIAIVNYTKIPALYKQDLGNITGHAVLLTHISEDGSVRYADPDFWGARREDGWYNNNKWISWADFSPAFNHGMWPSIGYRNGTVLVIKEKKPLPPPPPPITPPIDPCKDIVDGLKMEIGSLRVTVQDLGAKLTESEKTVDQQLVLIGELRGKLENEMELRTILANSNSELTKKLTDQKAEFEARMATAEEQIAKYKDQIQPLTDANSTLTNRVTSLEAQLSELQVKTVQAVSSRILIGELIDRMLRGR